jgi:hypothetical protein
LRATGGDFQKGLDWRTVKLIKDKYKIPLVIKGIATGEDAAIAVDHGVEWIYVSNHGGRQLDQGRGSMHVLPEIVSAVKGRAKVMVDGSFCRGTDIVKAIMLGADLVGIGRLQCWALAAGGEAGIVRMLELLRTKWSAVLACSVLPNSPNSTNPICIRRRRPTCQASLAPSRFWTSIPIGIEKGERAVPFARRCRCVAVRSRPRRARHRFQPDSSLLGALRRLRAHATRAALPAR